MEPNLEKLDSLLDADRNLQYHMLNSSTWVLHKAKVKDLKVRIKGPNNEYGMCLVSAEKHPLSKIQLRVRREILRFFDPRKRPGAHCEFWSKRIWGANLSSANPQKMTSGTMADRNRKE